MSVVAQLPGAWSVAYDPPAELNADGTGYTAKMGFYTTYYNLVPFVLVIGGLPQTVTSSGGTSFTRIVPLQHPLYSGLWASRVTSKAFGTASTTSTLVQDLWSHALVEVEFSSVLYGTDGTQNPYLTITARGSSIYTTLPNRKLTFPSGEVLGQDAGVFSTQETLNVTIYQAPSLDDATLNGLLGHVNSTTFLGYSAGYILFNTWDADYAVTMGGVQSYKKQLQVTYQSHPWNQFFDSTGALGTPVDSSSNPLYPSADLNAILTA